MALSVFDGTAWGTTQQLPFHLSSGIQTFSKECKLSLGAPALPVISWVADNVATFGATPFVAIPWNQTYLEPEELATTEDVQFLFAAPDRNDDVWIGWWGSSRGMIWTHTYTRAVATSPTVGGEGSTRVLNWSLSEPAPGSSWSVLRARGMGPFEDVARLQAGNDRLMSSTDASPPEGILRYRVRREHVDARYRWLSEITQWPTGAQAPLRWGHVRLPVADTSSIDLLGAAPGTTRLTMHDVFGRVVARAEQNAGGTGRDVFAVGQLTRDSKLPAGIYFLRAVDSSGAVSIAAKIVLLD